MGFAARQLLEASGVRVIGVSNTGDAEIIADLSTEVGVDQAIQEIQRLTGGRVDGVFANAGVDGEDAALVFGLNYFGVIRLLEGLHPMLTHSGDGRVVINASNSVVITPGIPQEVVDALLADDRDRALSLISKQPHSTYQVSKSAITRWARLNATSSHWAGSGISMNILAPGVVMTALIAEDMKNPRKAAAINALPKPLGKVAQPENIAPLVKFLMLEDSTFILGQVLIIDGGTEAVFRGNDTPSAWDIGLEEFRDMISNPAASRSSTTAR